MELLDILNAINARLVEKWPARTVYIDVCPVDFARPSFWLTVEKHEQTDAAMQLVRHDAQLKLTLYDEKDDHYESSWQRLFRDAADAMKLLTPPLQIGIRAVTLQIKALPREPDAAYLQLTASWMDQRPSGNTGTTLPPATSTKVRVEIKNH